MDLTRSPVLTLSGRNTGCAVPATALERSGLHMGEAQQTFIELNSSIPGSHTWQLFQSPIFIFNSPRNKINPKQKKKKIQLTSYYFYLQNIIILH